MKNNKSNNSIYLEYEPSKFSLESYILREDYDTPIHTIEKDNRKILLYELIGLSQDDVKVEVEFINKTKQTYLNIKGNFKDELTDWGNDINIHLLIDTDIYDGYKWDIQNGILAVELFEIINKSPDFEEKE